MTNEPDAPSGDDRPAAALAGQFLHQRAAFHSPGPGGRIDELDDPEVTEPDRSEEKDAE